MKKNYKLNIIYDGSSFFGWQVQKSERTVQGEIERELKNIFKTDKINLIGSGRTDSGVHANCQVANFQFDTEMNTEQIKKALNRKLSNDVYIKDCIKVNTDFNSRFSAVRREYIYQITEDFNPLNRMYYWHCKWPINQKRLNECSNLLLGEHDFSLFSKASSETKNKICKIYDSKWSFNKTELNYKIVGNRFLQHMVRLLVGTMIEVSREKIKLKDFKNILENKDSKISAVRAPAQGLFLNEVYYD